MEFLPAAFQDEEMAVGLKGQPVRLDDAQIRTWAAQQLQANRDQQDAARRAKSQQSQQSQHRNLDSSYTSTTTTTSASSSAYKLSPFVEGESDYDEYQQAWRLLGFMIDCDDQVTNWMTDDWYQQNGQNREGSGDQGTGDMCTRYVLWAAVR